MAATQVENDTIITVDENNSVTLANTERPTLTADDFGFLQAARTLKLNSPASCENGIAVATLLRHSWDTGCFGPCRQAVLLRKPGQIRLCAKGCGPTG